MARMSVRLMSFVRRFGIPIFVSIYFLLLTARAVTTFFSPDDLMNLYQAWVPPAATMLKWNVFFFLPSELSRPLASAVLRILYLIFGFHPVPFKIVNLMFLVANIFLTYAIAKRLAGTKTAAAFTALLGCYEGKAVQLYFDTGYIFDVLCYFFYFWAALFYLRSRDRDRAPNWRDLTTVCLLYIGSINSKEIGVTFPVFLLLYEVIYHGWPNWSGLTTDFPKHIKRWLAMILTGLITLAMIRGRILAPHALIHTFSAYQPTYSWERFIHSSGDYMGSLFPVGQLSPAAVLSIWGAMLAFAVITRKRVLIFAWLFILASPLPVIFLEHRGLSQYYIALFGWALYAGVTIDLVFSAALKRFDSATPARTRVYAGSALLSSSALVLALLWSDFDPQQPYSVLFEGASNRSFQRQLRRLEPRVPPNARWMFLNDPINPNIFDLIFLIQLTYGDRSIDITRGKLASTPPTQEQLAKFDRVFDFRAGHLYELQAPWHLDPQPMVILQAGRAAVFHSDWAPVDTSNPAQRGEYVLLKAADLGATDPPLPPGAVFPQDPLSTVTSKLTIRVNGEEARVESPIGWPNEANLYRVDVTLPANLPSGMCWIQITADGRTGPPVEFPVR